MRGMRAPSTLRVLLVCTFAACVNGVNNTEGTNIGVDTDEIVGGSDTTIAEHPWQVALTLRGNQFCGGSIVSPDWILTSRTCTIDGTSALGVVAGITRKSQREVGQIRTVDAITAPPGFIDAIHGNDIALLHVSPSLDLSGPDAKSICWLKPLDNTIFRATAAGAVATVTGWGALSSGGPTPDILQSVDIPIVSNAQVLTLYGLDLPSDELAAGVIGIGGKDACARDTGGPLTVRVPKGSSTQQLAGVVSWGFGCALRDVPGFYARVSSFDAYMRDRVNGRVVTQLALTNQSGSFASFTHHAVTVADKSLALSILVRGGFGDADLYVQHGSQPTTAAFVCRSANGGNDELCTIDSPAAGTWFISLRGSSSSAYSGVSITAVTIVPPPLQCPSPPCRIPCNGPWPTF